MLKRHLGRLCVFLFSAWLVPATQAISRVARKSFGGGTNFTGTPLQFEQQQILAMNVLLAPLWIIGVVAPFFRTSLRQARFLSIGFIATTAIGEAAALDVYGSADGLPPGLCGQNQYFLWGNRGYDGNILIHVNGDPNRWRRGCESVDVVGDFGTPYAMPYENERPIFICRGTGANIA